jgi:hypothetical protein
VLTPEESATVLEELRSAFTKASDMDGHQLLDLVRSMPLKRITDAIAMHHRESGRNTYKPSTARIAEIAARADAPAQQTIPTPAFADIIRRHEPRAAGKAVLGAGVNPGFVMDFLAVTLATMVRRITAVDWLRDVGPVTFPAYEQTTAEAEARSQAEALRGVAPPDLRVNEALALHLALDELE